MPIEIISTPGAANANSFASREEVNAYFAHRLPLDPPWVTTGDSAAVKIIMAARIIESYFSGKRTLIRPTKKGEGEPYFIIGPSWTGEIATSTQSLSWGRIGMFDHLGRVIATGVIPSRLKEAQAELAGQLGIDDRTLDNDIIASGISSIKASSVEIKFRDGFSADSLNLLPTAVIDLLVPSWYTAESIEYLRGRRARLWNL